MVTEAVGTRRCVTTVATNALRSDDHQRTPERQPVTTGPEGPRRPAQPSLGESDVPAFGVRVPRASGLFFSGEFGR